MANKKPDLDEATIQIARRMLSAPPKPHEKMKIGKRKTKEKSKKTLPRIANLVGFRKTLF